MSQLPDAQDFDGIDVIDLDIDGALLDQGERVAPAVVNERLKELLVVDPRATDIFVFVHGWQNTPDQAIASARRLFAPLSEASAQRYDALDGFRPQFFAIRWPSTSSVLPHGYRLIRDRAHAMTTTGHGAHVIGALLGYLDQARVRPDAPAVLRTSGGQYLHCIGHSFGCRMLGEAITWAADPPEPNTLAWPWPSVKPFAVDTFLALQMAAPPTIFSDTFGSIVEGTAPIAGPVVMTFSTHDRALSTMHRIPEGVPGIGAVGAAGAAVIQLHDIDHAYHVDDFAKLTNVDASWCFIGGSFFAGSHSEVFFDETIHLLFSLANLAR